MAVKRGRLSNNAKEFIERNVESMTVEEIAAYVERTPEMVKDYIKNELKINDAFATEADRAKSDLENKEIWAYVKQQFEEDELEFIKSEWRKIVAQFNFDVLPTEELQILEVVQITVFLNRIKKRQLTHVKDTNELRKKRAELEMKLRETEDKQERAEIKAQIATSIELITFAEQGANTCTKEYKDYMDQKHKILQSIKGTRDQRIARIENSKETFIDFIVRLVTDDDVRRKAGYEMERMRQAALLQKKKLSDYHTYDDDEIDQPFLNGDTVLD